MGTDRVEEVTVVADYQHGMFEVGKIFFQPGYRVHIQVVGRLIQQQVVRISKQRLRQHHTHLLLTTQVAHQCIVLVFLYSQSAQQDSRVTLGIPAFQLSKFFFQFRRLDAVFIGKIFFRIKSLTLFHDVPQHRMSHQYRIEHRMRIELKVVLTQDRKTFARSQCHASFRGVKLSRNHFQEGGLTRTVGTDNTVYITIRELHVHVIIQHSFSKLNGYV